MIGMNIQTDGHVFTAETPDQLERLLRLLEHGAVMVAVFLYGLAKGGSERGARGVAWGGCVPALRARGAARAVGRQRCGVHDKGKKHDA